MSQKTQTFPPDDQVMKAYLALYQAFLNYVEARKATGEEFMSFGYELKLVPFKDEPFCCTQKRLKK